MSDEAEFDVDKHIAYWRDGALESWKDAEYNIKGKRIAFGLFATHLAIEKALKAHVVKNTMKLPPMIHNLTALANLTNLKLSSRRMEFLIELNPMNIVSRYPGEVIGQTPSHEKAKAMLNRAKDVLEWLIKEL